jgi:ATP-dependent Clp protease protease subunit
MKKLLLYLLSPVLFSANIQPATNNKTVYLTPDNSVNFNVEVTDESVAEIEMKIEDLSVKRGDRDYPIYLVMNCPGGSIYAGEKFIQFAKTVYNLQTVSIFAASMCSAIVEGLPGERHVTEHGILMFHRAKGSFQGQFEDGEVESQLRMFKHMVRTMEQRNANRIGITLEKYKENVKDEWWMYGDENLSSGAADKSSDIVCSPELIAAQETKTQDTLFGPVTQTVSACPLMQ